MKVEEKFLLQEVLLWALLLGYVSCQRPSVVNVGAIFSFDSVIGRAAKPAIKAAELAINDDPRILNGTKLRMLLENAECNVFMGSIAAFEVMEYEIVAMIGPQSSSIARMISEIANGFHVPLLSFSATDPTLSALQYPYFLRTTPSDSSQMAAVADLIDFYGWKEVIAVYADDNHGRNGVAVLDDRLYNKSAKPSYKLPLPVNFNKNDIRKALKKSRSIGPRVYVVHLSPDPRLRIFAVAEELQMMTYEYVWFATDWLSVSLDATSPNNRTSLQFVEGVIGLREHIPESSSKKKFLTQLRRTQKKPLVNSYGYHAYDTVWAVAYAVDKLIKARNDFTFSFVDKFLDLGPTQMQLRKLKGFDHGDLLLQELLGMDFAGVTGRVRFGSDRNVIGVVYDIINIGRNMVKTIGYWSSNSVLSVLPPEKLRKSNRGFDPADQKLLDATWPGGAKKKPRGWIVADKERPLRIGVPRRVSFVEFATETNHSHRVQGYCIDLFLEALKFVPYDVPYVFEPFGNGRRNPNYTELVKKVAAGVFDGAVGDIAIVTSRTKMVDFTQPFVSTGLVVVAPAKRPSSNPWIFLKPFSVRMWCIIAAGFVTMAVVIWLLEHRVNSEFRGPPREQIATMFLFSFSTLFKRIKEEIVSALGRVLMILWLFVLLVITSSYTANLTSILTVEQLSSPITGIDSLIDSNWPIGYQVGSFAYRYLAESLHVPRSRLVALGSPDQFASALRRGPHNGGVAAIVDERSYATLFLSKYPEFEIIGRPFTRNGWGFAFQRDSPFTVDMSSAILKLSETGKLQEIHKKWFCKRGCPDQQWHDDSHSNQIHLWSFRGLFLVCGAICLMALFMFSMKVIRQYCRYRQTLKNLSSPVKVYGFSSFVNEKEDVIKQTLRRGADVQEPGRSRT